MIYFENLKVWEKGEKTPKKRCEIIDIEEFSYENPGNTYIFLKHSIRRFY